MQQKADPDTRFNLAPGASLTRVLPMPLVNTTFSFHNHLPVGGAFTRSLDVFAMCGGRTVQRNLSDSFGFRQPTVGLLCEPWGAHKGRM